MTLRNGLVTLVCVLLMGGMGACGPSSSDQSLKSEPGGNGGTPMANESTHTSTEAEHPFASQSVSASAGNPLANSKPAPSLKGLDSLDPHVRLHALEQWPAAGPKASLDPLFAALEDEDDAVRAKAVELIERYWVLEKTHR